MADGLELNPGTTNVQSTSNGINPGSKVHRMGCAVAAERSYHRCRVKSCTLTGQQKAIACPYQANAKIGVVASELI